MKCFKGSWYNTLLIAVGLCLLGNISFAQNGSIGSLYQSSVDSHTLRIDKGTTLKQALERIEGQFGIVFVYRTDTVEGKRLAKDKFLPKDLDRALAMVLENQSLEVKRLNAKSYGIYLANSAASKVPVQEVISGTVTDAETGETVPGVNILVQGTTIGTSTGGNGEYELTVPSLQDTLVASFVGYETQRIPINGRTTIDIQLVPATLQGEELVVVGYGTQRAEDVTGSVSQVQSSTIENQPVADPAEALQGAAPNLTIQQPSGEPGAGFNINVRGISTMNNNDPLVVVDGVVGGSLSDLNPNNIKTISVLKDAGSAAIYGSRAANGVILVTTKSGTKNSDPTVTFSSQVGVNSPNILYEPVKGYQNAILRNQALVNAGNSPIYTPEEIRTLKEEGDIEWFMDSIFEEAVQQDYNLAIAGGSDHTTYRVSGRYFDQGNNFVGDYGLKRYNFRINVNTEYGKFSVDSRLSLQRSDIKNHAASTTFLIADAKRTPPYYNYRMQAENGNYLLNDVLSEFNPLGELEQGGYNESINDVYTGVLQVGYDITESLQARANFSAIVNSNESLFKREQVPYYASGTAEQPANISGTDRNTNNDNYRSILINPNFVLDYADDFGENH
ncbi:MAG: SusC/RagA family TonB-linked outer membrane protein, partial [Balneolaceae bacterium]|nr:SusC/RagA family TonB-linked outer membrane protein [Balneolaceae bacterium]